MCLQCFVVVNVLELFWNLFLHVLEFFECLKYFVIILLIPNNSFNSAITGIKKNLLELNLLLQEVPPTRRYLLGSKDLKPKPLNPKP